MADNAAVRGWRINDPYLAHWERRTSRKVTVPTSPISIILTKYRFKTKVMC